jgi:hypothetical protein
MNRQARHAVASAMYIKVPVAVVSGQWLCALPDTELVLLSPVSVLGCGRVPSQIRFPRRRPAAHVRASHRARAYASSGVQVFGRASI